MEAKWYLHNALKHLSTVRYYITTDCKDLEKKGMVLVGLMMHQHSIGYIAVKLYETHADMKCEPRLQN